MHTQPVTCLRWVAGHSLLSCGLDGRIVLSMLKVTTLEAIKSSTISVTDLPRSLKKSNVSSRKVGIASVTGSRQETYLAGETGALWTLTPDDLGVRAIAAETEGIEQAEFYENSFMLSTSNGKIRRLRRSDNASTSEPLGIHSSRPFCRRGSLFLFVQDNGIVGFDATDEAIVLKESVRLSAIDVNEDGELVGIDERNNLCFYKFSDAL
ncbi:Protein Y50C1A.2 [Aphelenchoides avenae]|nr:Protein Y50C1A.2 [Aphelenchus avenae]